MTEESAQEVLTALDGEGGATRPMCQGVQIGRGIIGQAMMFEVGPDIFDGIELRGVGREVDPMCRTRQEALPDRLALVRLETVPDEDDGGTQLALQLLEKLKRAVTVDVGIWIEAEVEREAIAGGRDAHGSDRRYLAVCAGALTQQRRTARRAPGAANQGGHQQARFVDEDDAGPQARSVFFTRGQSCLIQAWMRSSSLSNARRVGFWGENPSPCRSRLTCAG